jgi:hypothetical protein
MLLLFFILKKTKRKEEKTTTISANNADLVLKAKIVLVKLREQHSGAIQLCWSQLSPQDQSIIERLA